MANSRKLPVIKALPERVAAAVGRHLQRGARVTVGLSGGIDSVVLLDVMREAAVRCGFELSAVHVNHQINPLAATWAGFCRDLCDGWNIPLQIEKVVVPAGDSLEASARVARYAVYAALTSEAVVLGHNQDDQAETLLLQLLRGSGVKGVSAMPEYRAGEAGRSALAILRPLLDVTRAEISAYADARQLQWIDDDSNADTRFDRNFIRHRVLPLIAERYPACRNTLARASSHFAEAAELLDAAAVADAGDDGGEGQGDHGRDTLDLARLRVLPAVRVKNALRHFLWRHDVLMPNTRRLDECVRQLLRPEPEARIGVRLEAHELRSYEGRLHLVPLVSRSVGPFEVVRWQGEAHLPLPPLGGVLAMEPCCGRGISVAKLAGRVVTLRTRQAGLRLRLELGRPSRTLKNLWQESATPPWRRLNTPLVFVDDELVCVPGIGVAAAFRAAGSEAGIDPDWRLDRG